MSKSDYWEFSLSPTLPFYVLLVLKFRRCEKKALLGEANFCFCLIDSCGKYGVAMQHT